MGGRLQLSDLPYSEKHLILLPPKHHVTQIIVREKSMHRGTQGILNALRSKFWLINGRNSVKSVIHKCVRCTRAKPITPNYVMGNLLRLRLIFTRPFLQSDVDFCGPFHIKEKRFRNRKREKIYIAVFVCLSVKAIHLELVQDWTSKACLAAIRRFFFTSRL